MDGHTPHGSDVTLEIPITVDQYDQIANRLEDDRNNPPDYNLFDYNCTDYAIDVHR